MFTSQSTEHFTVSEALLQLNEPRNALIVKNNTANSKNSRTMRAEVRSVRSVGRQSHTTRGHMDRFSQLSLYSLRLLKLVAWVVEKSTLVACSFTHNPWFAWNLIPQRPTKTARKASLRSWRERSDRIYRLLIERVIPKIFRRWHWERVMKR